MRIECWGWAKGERSGCGVWVSYMGGNGVACGELTIASIEGPALAKDIKNFTGIPCRKREISEGKKGGEEG